MDAIVTLVTNISNLIWSVYVLIPLLIIGGLYFTISTKFSQFTMIPEMFRSLTRKSIEVEDKKHVITPMQAFFIGLSSRVGTGNLAGVAIAISVGGPGAMFWMWIIALIGSSSALIESSLAQLYKVHDKETIYRGGPAYYMQNGLNSKLMATTFAVSISICFGLIFNAVQSNTISGALANSLSISDANLSTFNMLVGLFLVILTGIILFGGAQWISKATSAIVPFMAGLYLILALLVVIIRIDQIPYVLQLILTNAFTVQAGIGGGAGAAFMLGLKRGLFSNEAGMGSAPNAAASATTDHPVNQGLIQSLGVFVDTLIICSATGFIILSSGVDYQNAEDGIALTQNAMASVLGDWATVFLAIAIFFFAFSSILGNYFYSQSNIEYLKDSKAAVKGFKVLVLLMVFWGAIAGSTFVWTLADLFMGIMAIINIIAILLLSKQALLLLKDYKEQRKTTDSPIFDSSKYPEFDHITIWNKKK